MICCPMQPKIETKDGAQTALLRIGKELKALRFEERELRPTRPATANQIARQIEALMFREQEILAQSRRLPAFA